MWLVIVDLLFWEEKRLLFCYFSEKILVFDAFPYQMSIVICHSMKSMKKKENIDAEMALFRVFVQ